MSAKILVVDDKPNMRKLLTATLGDLGEVTRADGGKRAIELLTATRFDIVVTDIRMPDVDGHEVLLAARRLERPPEVILTTGYGTLESAIEALRAGAFDYVKKPFDPDQLRAIVERAVAKHAPRTSAEWKGIVGSSPAIREVMQLVPRIAASDATLLICGESGTGKELAARAIHELSNRSAGPFIAINCAAIPAASMEAELFGHARGAFAGASAHRAGLFEEANRGTLFLDEIGEMRRALQAKLTRALEARAVRRVGEANERPVDVRVVASTHRDLPSLVAQGAFREDLFYRLKTCVLRMPPLRDRPEDIPALVEHFLALRGVVCRVTPEAMAALTAHRWPGNVRELKGAIDRAAIVAERGVITREDLPPELLGAPSERAEPPIDSAALTYREALDLVRAEGIKRYLEALLTRFGGNVVAAAEHADLERESFYRLCRKHGINPGEFRGPHGRDA